MGGKCSRRQMDLLEYLSDYDIFKLCIRGSLNSVSPTRRSWLYPAFSQVINNAKVSYLTELQALLPEDNRLWSDLAIDRTDFLSERVHEWLDVSTRGRLIAGCAFLSFILDNWPASSNLTLTAKIDRLCAAPWLKIISEHTNARMSTLLLGQQRRFDPDGSTEV